MDYRASDHHALRPVRVDRPLPFRVDRQLRRARWKIELVRRDDLDMLVRAQIAFFLLLLGTDAYLNIGISLSHWCSGSTQERSSTDSSPAKR